MLKWDHKYELGHERIDAEHRIFLGLIIDFHEAAKEGHSREKLVRILNEIAKYADFHFVSEENIMIDCAYPEQHEHARLHGQLLAQVRDRLNQFVNGAISPEMVYEFLFNWFALHTSNEDKKLVGFIKQ